VGLVPGYGIVPETAVAYGGTYVVGLVAARWYETGLLTEAERKRITAEAASVARLAAGTMVEQARTTGGKAGRDRPVCGVSPARGPSRRTAVGAVVDLTRQLSNFRPEVQRLLDTNIVA
jgi:hypothetical protein